MSKQTKSKKSTAKQSKKDKAMRDIADVVIKESGAADGLCRYRMIATDEDIADGSKS